MKSDEKSDEDLKSDVIEKSQGYKTDFLTVILGVFNVGGTFCIDSIGISNLIKGLIR